MHRTYPQDLERDIQVASIGLPSTLDEGTCKSKPFPESTATHPKDSGGNKQHLDKDITSITLDEGMAKTTPHPKGQLIKYFRKMSRVLFNRMTEKQWKQHKEAAVSYASLKASIKEYYEENIAHRVYHARSQAHALKQEEALAAWTKSSTNMAWNLGSRMTVVKISQTALKHEVSFLRQDTLEIKSIMKALKQLLELIKKKRIATESEEYPLNKLVPASTIIHPNLDEPVRVKFMINGKIIYLAEQEIQEYYNKEEKMKKAAEEKKLLAVSRPELINVIRKEAKKLIIDPKEAISTTAGETSKKAQDAEHEVLKREHSKTVKRKIELNKKRAEEYILKKILDEPKIQSALPAPVLEQVLSQTSGRKRKHIELEPKIKMHALECNRILPEGVPFVNNRVIEEPKYGIFFINVFSDHAFQRWEDIHKVRMDSFVSYLVMALMVKTGENA
nr:copia protein [Tanacetum cinerariifolium]